jgi:hypothetical protein
MDKAEDSRAQRLLVRLGVLAFLAAAVAWGAWIRVDTTLRDPNFDAADARGLLRSDPALLLYLTQRIAASDGAVPEDFRAEPRLQHPFVTDVPAEFPIGQEFLVAWAARELFPETPLHVVALRVMALVSASLVVGVYCAARAASGRVSLGLLAAFLALVTPANYRTIGFLMVGEDLALPLFVLHLGWLAAALRARSGLLFAASGLALAAALSTWHALSFVATLELLLVFGQALWRGRGPFELRPALWVLAAPLAAGLLVPVLRASGFLVSPAAALTAALVVLSFWRRPGTVSARVLLLGVAAVGAGLGGALAPTSYAHVHAVVLAKLAHLGRLPADPRELSFDARLLWQGPFESLAPLDILAWCGPALALFFAWSCLRLWRARARNGAELLLVGLALVAWPAALMFARLSALVGIFVPAAAALALVDARRRWLAWSVAGILAVIQAAGFARYLGEHAIDWYPPRAAREELARLVEWVQREIPRDEPILGDFVNSPALLVHAGNAIVLQPKYETDRSRRAAEAFLATLYAGTPAELATLMVERFECRYLLVDVRMLWDQSRYTAGLPPDLARPLEGSAAAALFATDEALLAAVPEFELLYRGRSDLPWCDYRVFRRR